MNQQVPTVDVTQLPADAALLDVREDDEWEAGHAPDATHMAMSGLAARLGELPTDSTLYVICRSGVRSARVAAYLNANGWDAVNVAGGMNAWYAAGRAMVADSGDPWVLP